MCTWRMANYNLTDVIFPGRADRHVFEMLPADVFYPHAPDRNGNETLRDRGPCFGFPVKLPVFICVVR